MKITGLHVIVPSLLLSAAPALRAGQVVADFDQLATYFPSEVSSPLIEDGVKFENVVTNQPSLQRSWYMFGQGHGFNTGHKALSPVWTGTTNRITAASGAPFTLVSMQLSPMSSGSNATLTFIGTKAAGGTVSQTLTTGTAIGGVVRSFSSDFQNIVSVTWINTSDGSTYSQFDNVTVILAPEIIVTPAVTITESAASITIPVELSETRASATSVTWTIADGTAVQPGDYTRPGNAASGTLSIPAGQLTASLTIPIVNDAISEALEQFTVTFSGLPSGTGFRNGNSVTTVKIGNDDGTGFPGWMSGHGLTAAAALPEADPNGDGISNIESWLFRINPAGPSPAAWLARRPAFSINGSGQPVLQYTVPTPLPTDVSLGFQESTSLSAWTMQAERAGFGVGSLWSGPGQTRVTESTASSGRTISMAASQTTRIRPKALLRMKYSYTPDGSGS